MTIKRLLRQFSLLLLCVVLTQLAFSQTKTISGKVTDDKGNPIQGATVTVRGLNKGTSTDATGSFSLNVPASAKTLVISSIGYTEQQIAIGTQDNFNVSLVTSSSGLNEVVVVGYGTARKKDLTGSVSSVSAKDFNQGPLAAPDELLQNKVPGLEVANSGGQPGGATTVRIRGTNSLLTTGNVLYVVDGVPLDGRDATPSLNLSAFGAIPATNPLTYINPADIQQMDVLKDASSAAIFGSRGANGVIVITTKKGTAGPIQMDFSASLGGNAGLVKTDGLLSASEFRSELANYKLTGNGYDSGASVNALKAVSQNTLSQNYNLAISGGNENGKFRASFLGSNTQGYIQKSDLDKYIATFGGTYNFIDKRVIIDFSLISGHTTTDMPLISNTAGSIGNITAWILNWNPTMPFYTPSGQFNLLALGSQINPLAALAAYNDRSNVNTLLANISARVKIMDNLEYKFLYAINNSTGTRNTSIDGFLQGITNVSGVGFANIGNATLTSQTFTHTLTYRTDLTKNLKFDVVAGYEYWTTSYSDQNLTGTGFDINNTLGSLVPVPLTSQMQDATTLSTTSASDPTVEIQSYFGRVNFNLSDKYYLTGTFRADGSNKFGVNNKYGYFPSIAGRWVISNEDFMKGSVLSNLAVRGSWGITGDQGFPAGAALAQYNFSLKGAIGEINVPNPNLKWQQTQSIDIGLDYGILDGRIFGSFDYYRKNTTDLIYPTTAIQPAPSGSEYINLNANLINSGIEFLVGADIVRSRDFTWTTSFNIYTNHNLLKNFNEATIPTGAINGNGVSGTFAQAIANGEPLDEFYLPHFLGYSNGQDSVTSKSFYAGNPNPSLILGWSNTFRYKRLSLNFNLGGSFGYKVFNNDNLAITNIYNFNKGFNTNKSAFTSGEAVSDGLVISDRYLESGNFVKLRNLSLTYSFGNAGRFIKNLNIFVTGSNLFIITKFTGFDPEINIDKNNNGFASRSMEYLPYPTPRVITGGVRFSL
jgi:iron complex outermembrane receptor protein